MTTAPTETAYPLPLGRDRLMLHLRTLPRRPDLSAFFRKLKLRLRLRTEKGPKMPKIKRKPGWRRVKGLPGFHRVPKRKARPGKRAMLRQLSQAVAAAIGGGLDFPGREQ